MDKYADPVIASSPSEILVAESLRKSYGPRRALLGLSFSLNPGRVLGFLGPNGAGKTTSIRILTTILQPDSGHFYVNGISHEFPEKIRRLIGVLPESLGFPKQITGFEFLSYYGQLYGRASKDAKRNARTLLEEVGMTQRSKSLIGGYSRGMRQRLGIARALVNDPVVVFLDEPTLGLDPRGQQELLALIDRIARDRNVGIILCSHQLSEIEGVCDDVVILKQGKVVANGTVTEIIGQKGNGSQPRNVLRIQVPPVSVEVAQKTLQGTPHVINVTRTGEEAAWLRVELDFPVNENSSGDQHINNRILEALIQIKVPILSFEAEGSRLQDVFFQLTEEISQ